MTIAFILKAVPWLLGLAGIVFGLFRHQQAKTATAQADEAKAAATAQIRTAQVSEAQANTKAAQSGAAAQAARIAADNAAAAQSPQEVKNALDPWTRQ
jgi:sRNA-binding protein